MLLSGVSSVLSRDGLPSIKLMRNQALLETLPIVAASAAHRSFILSTWVKSYEASARRQRIQKETYAKHEPLIAESRWQDCWVVTDDDGYTVHAWICGYGDGALHHLYVQPTLRRLRIATRLIEFACGELKEYARPWPYSAHARVNPYLLRSK